MLTEQNMHAPATVDHTVSNPYARKFAGQFQMYIRSGYNLYLVMAGLHENICALQDEKELTFLYRKSKRSCYEQR